MAIVGQMNFTIRQRVFHTMSKVNNLVRQGSSSLKIVFDLQCILTKCSFNLLVEVFVTVIDGVDVLLFMELPPPAK